MSKREKQVRLSLVQEGWGKYRSFLVHMLGPDFETMTFASVEEFFSARGQTGWLKAHMEGIASPNTEVHFFLRQVRGLVEAFELDENSSLPEIFEQAAAARTTFH